MYGLKQLKSKAKSFYLTTDIPLLGLTEDEQLLFSYSQPGNKAVEVVHGEMSAIIKILTQQNEVKKENITLFTSDINDYYVLFPNANGRLFSLIAGPIPKSANMSKIEHAMQLLQYLFTPEYNVIAKPAMTSLVAEPIEITLPELSYSHVKFEQVSRYISMEEHMRFKKMILQGKTKEIYEMLTLNPFRVPEDSDPIDLGSNDELRALKNEMIAICSGTGHFLIDEGNFEYIKELIDQYIATIESLHTVSEVRALLPVMMSKFAESALEYSRSGSGYSPIVKEALRYMYMNLNKDIKLSRIADRLSISAPYLSLILKKETGMSFNDKLNSIRVKESKLLLLQSRQPINDIAIAVGFNYQNHFAKVFKKFVGMSPNQFRKEGM